VYASKKIKGIFLRLLIFVGFLLTNLYASTYKGQIVDITNNKPLENASVCDAKKCVYTQKNGFFILKSQDTLFHVKARGYRPFSFTTQKEALHVRLQPIKVKALYLTFWGASNNSKTLKNILKLIQETEANAIVVDVKNEYGSTQFLTGFTEANSYGAHKNRTNRNIQKFIQTMKEHNIYTIARIVTFKDELQASHNYDYAIKKNDVNKTIWRNHDHMAWVDPFDKRSHNYAISIAEEAAKVGYDEINFDYIRFPAKKGLVLSKKNTQENRIQAIESFLDEAQERLRKYGVFISVDTYGNICWAKDDNGIGQTVSSLAAHADYLAPMLYPSGFSYGSFHFKYPSKHPYDVIYRSIKHIQPLVESSQVRPWLQYFRDYTKPKIPYQKEEVQAQIQATKDVGTNGWMLWSPSSKYHKEYLER